jgi:HAD superfamily hydrolase (TIGR01509 family)
VAVEAVVFDLDGVILDSEHVWDEAREELARERGGRWHAQAQRDMMGMSSVEWSRYMHDVIRLAEPPEEISAEVVRRLEEIYRRELPLIPGAREAVQRISAEWPLGLASSSNRPLIDLVLDLSGLAPFFAATVSSEEVPSGKPAPDVYLEAARRLGVDAERCAAVEDSENGIRSGKAAGMRLVAVPNRRYPPGDEALAKADVVLETVADLTPASIRGSPGQRASDREGEAARHDRAAEDERSGTDRHPGRAADSEGAGEREEGCRGRHEEEPP